MTLVLVVLALLGLSSGWLPAAAAFLLATDLFVNGVGMRLTPQDWLSCAVVLMSVPASVILASILLERFAAPKLGLMAFRAPAIALVFVIGLESGVLIGFIESALQVAKSAHLGNTLAFYVAVLNATFFCSAIIVFCCLVTQLLFELPARWVMGRLHKGLLVPWDALRPLSFVVILSLAFNLVLGLYIAELSPTALVRLSHGKN